MAELNQSQKDFMNNLFIDYGLTTDDIHKHQHYKIITRAGIDKIQAKAGIEISYTVESNQPHPYVKKGESKIGYHVAIRARGRKVVDGKEAVIETFASANPENCTSAYYFEMAEKRAMARVVLKLEGFYQQGFFSEDEADAFKKTVDESRANQAAPQPEIGNMKVTKHSVR